MELLRHLYIFFFLPSYFLFGWLFSPICFLLTISHMSSIQVFTIHVICQYFFPVCVFILFPILIEEDTLLILMKSYLSFFLLCLIMLLVYVCSKFLPNPSSQIFSLVISSRSFRVCGFTFISLIHFELYFVHGVGISQFGHGYG